MRKLLTSAALFAMVVGVAQAAGAGELRFELREGLVTLTARDVSARQILAEWSRVAGTKIVNAEQLPPGLLTLALTNEPERRALDTILRNAGGYLAAQRTDARPGQSIFDSIVVMAVSRSAASLPSSASPAPATPADPFRRGFGPPGLHRPQPADDQDDDQDATPERPGETPLTPGGPVRPGQFGQPGVVNPAMFPPAGPGVPPNLTPQQVQPGAFPYSAPSGFPAQPGIAAQPSSNPSGIRMLGQPLTPLVTVPPGATGVPGQSPVPNPPGPQPQQQDPNRKP